MQLSIRKLLWWPASLQGRVMLVHTATLVAFALTSLGLYMQHEMRRVVEESNKDAEVLVLVMAPVIAESAIIGDLDTIKRLIERAVQDKKFTNVRFRDLNGAELVARGNKSLQEQAPRLLHKYISERLSPLDEPISAGGRDYGVLHVEMDSETLAAELWNLISKAALLLVLALAAGLLLVSAPLRRWLRILGNVREFDLSSQHWSAGAGLVTDVPLELRATFEVLARNAETHKAQLDAQSAVIRSLREVVSDTAADERVAPPPQFGGLEEMKWLSERVRRLVDEREASRIDLANQKFALDQHAVVLVSDLEGRMTYVNDKFCQISGHSRRDLLGRTHRALSDGLVSDKQILEMRAAVEAGEVWEGEIRFRAADGTLRWQLATIVPFLDKLGKVKEYISIRTDITRRKAIEAELQALNNTLELRVEERTAELTQLARNLENSLARERELGKMRERLTGMMSHEFRTPMSVITSAVDLLEKHEARLSPERRSATMDRLRRASARMRDMLDDALTISRLAGNRHKPQLVAIKLAELVRDIVDEIRIGPAESREINLLIDPEDMSVISDETLIRHILNNLLTNACKYSPSDRPVDVRVEFVDDRVALSVRDRGPGIDPGDVPHLFEPFYRGKDVDVIPGTGLGLAIAQNAATLLSGEIRIEPAEGGGTKASLILPRQAQQEQLEQQETQ